MKRTLVFTLVFTISIAVSISAIDRVVIYQGKLTDAFDIPVSGNSMQVTLKFYDAPTGGTQVGTFSETHIVTIENGLFTLQIGSTTTGGIPPSIFTGGNDIYLSVSIGNQEQLPRPRVVYVPYAMGSSGYTVNCDDYPGTVDAGAFCISQDFEPVMYKWPYDMQKYCENRGMYLCKWIEYSTACVMWEQGKIQLFNILDNRAFTGQATSDRSGTTNRSFGNLRDTDSATLDCYIDYGAIPAFYYATYDPKHFRCCVSKK